MRENSGDVKYHRVVSRRSWRHEQLIRGATLCDIVRDRDINSLLIQLKFRPTSSRQVYLRSPSLTIAALNLPAAQHREREMAGRPNRIGGARGKISRKKQMAPSWLNLSAHLNKSNVGCVPAASSSPSFHPSFLPCLHPSRNLPLAARSPSSSPVQPLFIPLSPRGLLSPSFSDIFAQYLKRLLMEIAIMPPAFSPSPAASQFFRKA